MRDPSKSVLRSELVWLLSIAAVAAASTMGCAKHGSGGASSSSGGVTGSGGTSASNGTSSSSGASSSGSGSVSSTSSTGTSGSSGTGGMCAPCTSDQDCNHGRCITEGVSTADWFCAPSCDPTSPTCPSNAHCFTFPGGAGCYPATGTCLPPASGSSSGSSSGSGGSSGSSCAPDGEFVGPYPSLCCSASVNANGYCGAGGSTGSPPHAGPGPCPENIPDIDTGLSAVGGRCDSALAKCAQGFTCVDTYCVLNGGAGPVQVTLSWDFPEDLDLHVIEPQDGGPEAIFFGSQAPCIYPDPGTPTNQCANGFPASFPTGYAGQGCEIWYGNVGPRPGSGGSSGDCSSVGWLDRDSDPGCSFDGINIENVIYATGVAAPRGAYMVRVDFWNDCAGLTYLNGTNVAPYPQIPFAVQVRSNGVVALYCDSFSPSDVDQGAEGAGRYLQTFIQLNLFPDGGLEFPGDAGAPDAGADDGGAPEDGGASDGGADGGSSALDGGLPDGG